jgi:hypothetical protein
MKSLSSMNNGRYHPTKCRGKVQKTEEEIRKGLFSYLLILATHLFGLIWSTLAGWLHHMPALPKLLLKFSNTHNFWSVGPKIMKIVPPQSLFRGACLQKVSKNLKLKWDEVTLPKTGLSLVGTKMIKCQRMLLKNFNTLF